jgi:hypothetical protein
MGTGVQAYISYRVITKVFWCGHGYQTAKSSVTPGLVIDFATRCSSTRRFAYTRAGCLSLELCFAQFVSRYNKSWISGTLNLG